MKKRHSISELVEPLVFTVALLSLAAALWWSTMAIVGSRPRSRWRCPD